MPVSKAAWPNMDWMRDPPPPTISKHESFVRSATWDDTPIGPMESWPSTLKTIVRLMMPDTNPTILYWGEEYTILYNEACIPLVGEKHPGMLGKSAWDVFPDFWDTFDKNLVQQRLDGKTNIGETSMLMMDRHGFLEETYFSWQLIPVIGEEGHVAGSYGRPFEVTKDEFRQRGSECRRRLSQQIAKTTNINQLYQAIHAGLTGSEQDLPVTLLYTVDQHVCHLQGSTGIEATHALAKEYIDMQYDTNGFAPAMLQALEKKETLIIEANNPTLHGLLHEPGWKVYNQPSAQFAIIPLESDVAVMAFLVVGLNPFRRVNDVYQQTLRAITDVIGPQISRILHSEEIERRSQLVSKARNDFAKSETKFARFAERSIVGFAVADRDRKIVYANEAWYKFSDADPNNPEFSGFVDSIHPDDVPIVEEWWEKALTQKMGGQFQFRSKKPFQQGDMFSKHKTALCACYADLNEEGDVESMMGFVMDISEHKWVEEQLRIRSRELEKSEVKYRNYAEHCPLGICRTDAEGYVQFGNDAWHEAFGFTRGQVLGLQPWIPFVEQEYLQLSRDFFDSFQKTPGPTAVELKMKDKMYTIQGGNSFIENGVWILATGFAEIRPDGTVDHIDFWVTDISAQKMATKILTEKMEEAIRLKTHQERFIDMISHEIRNPLSAVLHCGEEVVEAMKKCRGEISSSDADQRSGALSSLDSIRQHVNSALDAANIIMYCVQHQKQIVDDVLTLSKLDSDLLVVSPIPVQPLGLVRSSLRIFDHELKMTDIALSVFEDGSLNNLGVDWILLDPNRFLQIVINLVTNAIKFTKNSPTRRISVRVSVMKEPPSEDCLEVEFVPHRYSKPNPSTPNGDTYDIWEDVYLCLSVQDTGKGLTASERALLFNRFSQSPKTHIEYGGSGLGLFISRQITEMLGGRIGMTSEPGSGCTFAFFVKTAKTSRANHDPITQEPSMQLASPFDLATAASRPFTPQEDKDDVSMHSTEAPETDTPKRSVLVVEDNIVNQKVLCKLLRNRGFIVEAANHGKEALEALALSRDADSWQNKSHYDAILCDIEMPVMNGLEFATEVRALEAAKLSYGRIPIIGVTANVRSQQVNAAIEVGMDGVTTKPYRIHELVAHINKVCAAAERNLFHPKAPVD